MELIESVLGAPLRTVDVGPARASGMLPSHDAPGCRVELVTSERLAVLATALLATGARAAVLAPSPVLELKDRPGVALLPLARSVEDYARTLYRRLRDADDAGADVLLAVLPPPEGLAVLDRLCRAAAPDRSMTDG